ncbi:hypothetical protein T265_09219 [Opisthorchis viverrini]|uniref:Uncharacterized protein n=1 Tax=Opisthorchis viverrini TaxID=6198 RepID=A0A074ZHL5_OPIVI|nr:hypothetical protein T265_09219 [Opisthorchis viverrini]KER22735.1 hypothetical protein T265_09219 [Opisthorchis viverrini]
MANPVEHSYLGLKAGQKSHPLECHSVILVDEGVHVLVTVKRQTPRCCAIPYCTFFPTLTFQNVSIHFGLRCPLFPYCGGEMAQWSELGFTDLKVRASNPTFASQIFLSGAGEPGSIPALVLPSGEIAARYRMGVTPERLSLGELEHTHKLFSRSKRETQSIRNNRAEYIISWPGLPENTIHRSMGSIYLIVFSLALPRLNGACQRCSPCIRDECDQSELRFFKDSEVGNCKITQTIRSSLELVCCFRSNLTYLEEKGLNLENLWEGFQRQSVTAMFQWCQQKRPPTNISFLCLAAMPPEESLDTARFPKPKQGMSRGREESKGGEAAQWLEREFTDWKVRGLNPKSASPLFLSKPGHPGSISLLVLLSGDMVSVPRTHELKGMVWHSFFLSEALGYPTVTRNPLLIRFSKLHTRHFRYSVTERLMQPDADSAVVTVPTPYV